MYCTDLIYPVERHQRLRLGTWSPGCNRQPRITARRKSLDTWNTIIWSICPYSKFPSWVSPRQILCLHPYRPHLCSLLWHMEMSGLDLTIQIQSLSSSWNWCKNYFLNKCCLYPCWGNAAARTVADCESCWVWTPGISPCTPCLWSSAGSMVIGLSFVPALR